MSASWTSYSTFTRCIRHESTEAACTDAAAPRKAYYILDELFIAGELEESSKKEVWLSPARPLRAGDQTRLSSRPQVLSVCAQMDEMMDESKEEGTPNTTKKTGR